MNAGEGKNFLTGGLPRINAEERMESENSPLATTALMFASRQESLTDDDIHEEVQREMCLPVLQVCPHKTRVAKVEKGSEVEKKPSATMLTRWAASGSAAVGQSGPRCLLRTSPDHCCAVCAKDADQGTLRQTQIQASRTKAGSGAALET